MHNNDSIKTIAQSDPHSSNFLLAEAALTRLGIPHRPRIAAPPARNTEVAS